MTDAANLRFDIDSRSAVGAAGDLDRMNAASKRAEAQVTKMVAVNDNAAKATDRMAQAAGRARVAALALAAGLGLTIRGIGQMADTWSDLTSRVNLAVGSQQAGAAAMDRLAQVASRTYSSLNLTTESFIANSTALRELGRSTAQQLDYTEALNLALVVSGARADRARQVQDALAKAMALGKLQGDNLNSVIQVGGRVAQALAEELGVGVNQLRALGAQGKVTGDVVYNALTKRLETLRAEAEQMPVTIGDGFQAIGNAVLQVVGKFDQAIKASSGIGETLKTIADNLPEILSVVARAAVVAGVAMMTAFGPATLTAVVSLGRALVTQVVGGINAITVAMARNPIGFIATAITVAISTLILFRKEIGQTFGSEWADRIKTAANFLANAFSLAIAVVVNTVKQLYTLLKATIETAAALARLDFSAAAQIGKNFRREWQENAAELGDWKPRDWVADVEGLFQGKALTDLGDGASRAAKGVGELSDAFRQPKKAADEFIKSLRQEVEEIGKTEKEVRALQVARAIADAPLAGQKQRIAELSREREAALALVAANEALAAVNKRIADVSMTPAQKRAQENRAAILKAELTGQKDLIDATKLSIDVAENWARAQEIATTNIHKAAAALRGMNDNIEPTKSATDRLAEALEETSRRANDVANGIRDIGYALRSGDWAGAAAGLLRTISQIRAAFDKAQGGSGYMGTGSVLSAAGSVIGGTTGSVLGGAGSGMMAGATLGSVVPVIGTAVGAVVGGILGAIGGLFGSSSAKKKAQQDAAQQAAQAEADRQARILQERRQQEITLLQLQGKAVEALALQRQNELAAMDESNRARQREIYDLQDKAEAEAKAASIASTRRDLEIQIMEATGDAVGALAAKREIERAALVATDASLGDLVDRLYAAQDAAAHLAEATAAVEEVNRRNAEREQTIASARSALTEAYNRESAALEQTRDRMRQYADSFRAFNRELQFGDMSMASPGVRFSGLMAEAQSLASRVKLGDTAAWDQWQSVSKDLLDAKMSVATDRLDYQRTLAWVRGVTLDAASVADRQASIADQQLSALKAQVSGLITVNESVLTVAQAIANLHAAMFGTGAAGGLVAGSGATSVRGGTPYYVDAGSAFTGPDWIGTMLSDGSSVYQRNTGKLIDDMLMWEAPGGTVVWPWAGVNQKGAFPAFASGGDHMGGLRIVGETGPELEATGPSRIFNADQTRDILNRGGDIEGLRAEVANLRIAIEQVAVNTGKTARLAEKADKTGAFVRGQQIGDPVSTKEEAA